MNLRKDQKNWRNNDGRINKIESNVGLSEDGDYVAETESNYLNDAVSFKDADKLLDAQIKTDFEKNLIDLIQATDLSKTIQGIRDLVHTFNDKKNKIKLYFREVWSPQS